MLAGAASFLTVAFFGADFGALFGAAFLAGAAVFFLVASFFLLPNIAILFSAN